VGWYMRCMNQSALNGIGALARSWYLLVAPRPSSGSILIIPKQRSKPPSSSPKSKRGEKERRGEERKGESFTISARSGREM
jgi:hypothetical protein